MERFRKGCLWTVVALVLLGALLRAVLFKVWTVPEDPRLAASVAPTLAGGDVVLVLTKGTPGFGDLVRCADPEDPQQFVVGRIAGVEPDVVEVEGRRLVVNGKTYDAGTACPEATFKVTHPVSGSEVELRCDVVEMGGGWHYRGFNSASQVASKKRTEVGPGMVFLLSDNREHHDDSRDYGVVPSASCAERIVFRLWSKGGWSDDKRRMTYIR